MIVTFKPAFSMPPHLAVSVARVQTESMTRTGFFLRLALSLAIDVADATFGRVPLVGTVQEGVGTAILVVLWGPAGLLYLGELADFTEQVDGFIPTATLIGLYVGWREGFLLGKKRDASPTPPAPR
jgi:hypothetical protein